MIYGQDFDYYCLDGGNEAGKKHSYIFIKGLEKENYTGFGDSNQFSSNEPFTSGKKDIVQQCQTFLKIS